MFKKEKSTKLLIFTFLSLMLCINQTTCWWRSYTRCRQINVCLYMASIEWAVLQNFLPSYLRIVFSQLLTLKYWSYVLRVERMEMPWLWYFTWPIRSYKKHKPWPSWNHPQYKKYNGRSLEEDEGDDEFNDEEARKELSKIMQDSKNPNIERMETCSTVQDCMKAACEGIESDVNKYGRNHISIVAFYQSFLQVSYHRNKDELLDINYFLMNCMKNIKPDIKTDHSNLSVADRLTYDALEDGDDRDFMRMYSLTNIPGFNKVVTLTVKKMNGRTIEDDYGSNHVSQETSQNRIVAIPPMADQVF